MQAWDDHAARLIGNLSTDTGVDVIAKGCWHEARRGKEQIANLQSVVDTLGATPADGRQALRDFAELQYGGTYNILSEAVTFRGLLTALQAAVEAVLPVDGGGFITVPYARLGDSEPFFAQITPTQSAGIVTALQAVRAQISD